MPELCDIHVLVNGHQTFFLNQKIISKFSRKLRKIIKQEKRVTQIRGLGIEIDGFPGGADGFELVSRFCYNGGSIEITVSNVALLQCCAVFAEMTERASKCNLLHQTEVFLDGMFYWSLSDIVTCLKSCESFVLQADSCGLTERLMCLLISKIVQNSDINGVFASPSSFSPSPDAALRQSASTKTTTDQLLDSNPSSSTKAWWFTELTVLPPVMIERFVKILGVYGTENNSVVVTRFLLHYLKSATSNFKVKASRSSYAGLADTAVYGVILMGKKAFSCRAMFWVLRVVSGLGISRDCRGGLERLISEVLDQAKLDDLLVSGHDGSVYDVNLVVRLIRLFVHIYNNELCLLEKLKKVGGLIDKYLREISPDHNLKVSKFLGVANSLPDEARSSYNELYRAIDIYLEAHPCMSMEERSRICKCLNYEKLSLETCKDLAKNPRIPPVIAIKALSSQHSKLSIKEDNHKIPSSKGKIIYSKKIVEDFGSKENEEMRLNLEKMKLRMMELEKACKDIKGKISVETKTSSSFFASPRLC